MRSSFFFFNDTATTEIYTLSLHDALPICRRSRPCDVSGSSALPRGFGHSGRLQCAGSVRCPVRTGIDSLTSVPSRSEEHTSELQSRQYLVCRLLLEKKNNISQARSNNYPG